MNELDRMPYRTVADREHADGWHEHRPDPQCWACENDLPAESFDWAEWVDLGGEG